MKFDEFMSEAHQAIQSFEKRWNEGQRGEEPENWPMEMSEDDWWDQLICHIEGG